MTTDGAACPSVDGSRPISRFQEGSMNDRTSAAPPVQFLGPEEAAALERQFYGTDLKHATQASPKRARSISRRRERPMSAQSPLQSFPCAPLQPREAPQARQKQEEVQTGSTQKRAGFLGRVREALFGKPTPYKPPTSNVQNEIDKRTSLQSPPAAQAHVTQARPIPIPIQGGGVMKSQSSSHIPQLPASFHGGGMNLNDRPSRDEIMASYNELMATGFFQAHAIQSTRQPAPGTSLPNTRRAAPPLPTIPSPNRPRLDQFPKQPSFQIIPPSRDGEPVSPELPVPPMPSSMPPPPPLFPPTNQLKLKPSWESFRNGLRGRKRARAESSDDNASESASMLSQQLQSSSTSTQIATQVTGIGRRVSKKLRKMPSALAGQLQAKSDGMIRTVAAVADDEGNTGSRAVRMRSPSPAVPGMETGLRARERTSPAQRSVSGRLRKRGDRTKSPSRPPIALNNYPHLDPSRMAPARNHYQTPDWEPMEVDSISGNRVSMDSISRDQDMENVGHLLRDGQLGVAAEPLSVVPDLNRGIPSVPQIPKHYKHGRMGSGENHGASTRIGEAF